MNDKELGCKTFSKIYLEDSKKLEIFAFLLNTLVNLNSFYVMINMNTCSYDKHKQIQITVNINLQLIEPWSPGHGRIIELKVTVNIDLQVVLNINLQVIEYCPSACGQYQP